ncbi:hypothetical protein COR50_00180 [Chitinophaga caeni]|uniref:DUF4194 domain-containing protein n=1 Tax=Chitinophaga caeni TaxID=2029983 RepID=A0A291QP46_9BACT|nr:DUF4194 domain-containing protein [Chitinophaga caeni]ATL45701.1 hypothetical protein COR50_00180 [Chitinophaga caeni]
MNSNQKILPYAGIIVKLLKGPLEYLDKSNWEKLLQFQHELASFLQQLGLILVVDEQDGYAYLKHLVNGEDAAEVTWMQRRTFTYEESVMLVLLREMLAEFELSEATTRELIKKRIEIKEYAELFFKEQASRIKFLKEIDRLIDKMEEHGFLQLVEHLEHPDEQKFRIRKMIKAKVDGDVLDQFQQQLQERKEQAAAAQN